MSTKPTRLERLQAQAEKAAAREAAAAKREAEAEAKAAAAEQRRANAAVKKRERLDFLLDRRLTDGLEARVIADDLELDLVLGEDQVPHTSEPAQPALPGMTI